MKRAVLFALLLVGVCWSGGARAHNTDIIVLRIHELSPGELVTRWERLPGKLDTSSAYLVLRPIFPEHCEFRPPRLHCGERGLSGRLGLLGLGDVSAAALVHIERIGQPVESLTLTGSRPYTVVHDASAPTAGWSERLSFIGLGIEHILLGFDHLAFVLGLLWLVNSKVQLLKTMSAFTAGHSVTLATAALGYSHVPAAPVEAVIALSIALVAAELVRRERSPDLQLTASAPGWMALLFGLLHGLGFANALAELEITRGELPLALLGFNVGVEIGQLLFVMLVLIVGALLRRWTPNSARRLRPVGHYALGGLAMYWFIDRVLTFGAPS